MEKFRKIGSGEGQIFCTGIATGGIVIVLFTILYVIFANGLGFFWPKDLSFYDMKDGQKLLGTPMKHAAETADRGESLQLRIGNRDFYGLDFKWIEIDKIESVSLSENAAVIERKEFGNFYGFFGETPDTEKSETEKYHQLLPKVEALLEQEERLRGLNKTLNNELTDLRYSEIRSQNQHKTDEVENFEKEFSRKKAEAGLILTQLNDLLKEIQTHKVVLRDINGKTKEFPVSEIIRVYYPAQMSFFSKAGFYLMKIGELIWENPREANTEGGVFPAIFGTVILIFIMSIFSFPLGVIAAVYLRIYAKEGTLVKIVRIAVNNLAGVPSIVFGVFGLGFFVYGLGGTIDELFFSERLPNPTFGTGGILWSSLTLALLTVPVVIVATEEALSAIPRGMYEASVALGATKLQTLFSILLPIASPGMLTGFILAMARAAGEVAPLMITGVVKLSPSLVIDSVFPYVHLERKFMHLGFHIYDVGFQSPNVEAAKPMVYMTTILLLLIVLILTSTAIYLREKLKRKYSSKSF